MFPLSSNRELLKLNTIYEFEEQLLEPLYKDIFAKYFTTPGVPTWK